MFNYKMKQIFISYHSSKYNLYSLMFIVFNLCEHFPDDINFEIHKYNFLNSLRCVKQSNYSMLNT